MIFCVTAGRAVRKPARDAGVSAGVSQDAGGRNQTGARSGETGASGRVQGVKASFISGRSVLIIFSHAFTQQML